MDQSPEQDHSHAHHTQESYKSPNNLRQKNKKIEDEILIIDEKLTFGPGAEQVKIPVDVLEIEELDEIGSFSITFNVKISTNLKDLKNDQIFFQIASSVVNKTLVVGIAKDKTFFVSCLSRKNKFETCHSQNKVKNGEYHFGITVANEGNFTEVNLYLNGQNDSSLVFPSLLDGLQGEFQFGSDVPLGGFQGEIADAMFYLKVLSPLDIKECFLSRKISKGEKSTYQIRKEKNAYLATTEYVSKKKGVPVNLIRSHELEKQQPQRQPPQVEENKGPQMSEEEKRKALLYSMIEDLKDLLYEEEELFFYAREVAVNFEWIFNACSVLSPSIDEKGLQPKHTFKCLHNALAESEARYYPCYAITIDQFMKVIARADCRLQRDDVIKMAERIDVLDVNKEFGNFIYYDKFLIAIRNATLSKEEILNMNKLEDDLEKQIVKAEQASPSVHGDQIVTRVVAYNLIPIFEGADYFDQKDFIEANPDAVLTKIILSIAKATNHVKYIHFTYRLKNGKLTSYEVGKPVLSSLPGMAQELVHFTIDINDNEYLTGVKVSNFHANNANKVINYLSFALNTHPDGIVYGQFNGHPSDLKSFSFDASEHEDKQILGFYGAFREDLVGFGVYVRERVVIPAEKPGEHSPEKKKDEVVMCNEDTDEEYIISIPQLDPHWNEGRIQIIINRCSDCAQHRNTTSHEEADFAMKFNEWGNRIKDYFPNSDIVGNYDKPKVFGYFEVYIRGVGHNSERDEQGRVFLHQNYTSPQMKTTFAQVFETLVLYAFEYGNSIEMAKAQDSFLKRNANSIPKKWSSAHEHPCDVPERLSQTTRRAKGKGQIEDGTHVVCKHWACGARYTFDSMSEPVCQHHPGRYEFGSVHGLWPEGWTCCRAAWEGPGCKKGKHDPVSVSNYYHLCLNHGDVNPKGEKPDSACGKAFQDANEECKFHQGYLIGKGANAKWSCCGEVGESAPPCVSTSHRSAEWPEEEAKLYFVTREVKNPGLHRNEGQSGAYSKRATTSGYYKKIVPYVMYENPERKKAKEMEETENEPRVCMNWGCSATYKEVDNKKVKTCHCHPGKWDFGYTGITVSQATTEFLRDQSDVLLWKPHWTCCRQHWEAKGCTKTHHRGPLASEAVQPKYKWPNEDAQKYFRKTISPLWKEKLEARYQLEPNQIAQKFDEAATRLGSGGKIPTSLLPQLCDKLRLHLLIISEDLSPHLRFLQVINHTADAIVDDGSGYIDKKKFIEWWFAKLDE